MSGPTTQSISGEAFLMRLAAALNKSGEPKAESASEWTYYMTRVMFDFATLSGWSSLHFCSTTLKSHDTGPDHWARELLFDFTFFAEWEDYSLPVIIAEHENSWDPKAFHYDLWKLMLGVAPLRVMFGYSKNESGAHELAKSVSATATANAWRYPAGTEDLVFIGHGEMSVNRWIVVRREPGSDIWSDPELRTLTH